MQTEQARIVGYIRLAAPGQIEGPGDRAIPQMVRLRDWARAQASEIADVYVDDGVGQPALERLLHNAWTGDMDVVVCTLALAQSRRLAHQLGDHALDVDALGHVVAVAAVLLVVAAVRDARRQLLRAGHARGL
jgi:hypothetical protein